MWIEDDKHSLLFGEEASTYKIMYKCVYFDFIFSLSFFCLHIQKSFDQLDFCVLAAM